MSDVPYDAIGDGQPDYASDPGGDGAFDSAAAVDAGSFDSGYVGGGGFAGYEGGSPGDWDGDL
jgi:hypothetical protein